MNTPSFRFVSRTAAFVLVAMLGAALQRPAAAQEPGDPVGAYNFRVEIEGVDAGRFLSIDGLSMELEVIEYQDGDDLILRKRPGRAKFSNVTLKRGYTATDDLWTWWRSAALGTAGDAFRRTVSIVLLDPQTGADVVRWNLINAWPKSWKLATNSTGNEIAIEEIVLAVEDIRLPEPRN